MSDIDLHDEQPGRSLNIHQAAFELMIDALVERLSRPGPDGDRDRRLVLDWLLSERPPIAPFEREKSSAEFERPAVESDDRQHLSGGFDDCQSERARIDLIDALDLREILRDAVDRAVSDWLEDRALSPEPSLGEVPFAGGAASDAEAAHETRKFKRLVPDIGDFGL